MAYRIVQSKIAIQDNTVTITITTQAEFDALPNSFPECTYIDIKSDPTITIVVNRELSNAWVWACGESSVVARGNSTVKACGNSTVKACGNSRVTACGNSTVVARGNSTVKARDKSSVEARDKSSVVALDNSKVVAWDNSVVEARDNSVVWALDKSSVEAWDKSTVKYAGSLVDFSSWFLLNKDNEGTLNAMRKQFADQPEYIQKINMILLFS
jgi:hypothetical protein